ncbi:MAG: hypothetical protein LBJ23_07270 [Tannerella sp.]|jgi:hypothetical protein|nr:hypothetical protein [Tannerella sp.]
MNTKQLQLVTREQTRRLQKLGFNWAVIYYYFANEKDVSIGLLQNYNADYYNYKISAPTVALSLQYFEQEKGIKNSTELVYKFNGIWKYKWKYIIGSDCNISNDTFETLQSAQNALLDELLTLFLKEKEQ